ncbi:MAG: hypothetical protein WBQ95_14110 [Terracidiphilus sp.]
MAANELALASRNQRRIAMLFEFVFENIPAGIGYFTCQIKRVLEQLETPRILRYEFPKNEALSGPDPSYNCKQENLEGRRAAPGGASSSKIDFLSRYIGTGSVELFGADSIEPLFALTGSPAVPAATHLSYVKSLTGKSPQERVPAL